MFLYDTFISAHCLAGNTHFFFFLLHFLFIYLIFADVSTVAKDYMIKMMTKAITLPCDIGTGNDIELTLPKWYDADKVKR